jgi:hypothetical protein
LSDQATRREMTERRIRETVREHREIVRNGPYRAGKQECNYAEDTPIYDRRKRKIAVVGGEVLAKEIASALNERYGYGGGE